MPSVSPTIALILERLEIGTRCLEPGGEVILADAAKIERLDRLAVPLHGGEQLADAAIVDAVAVAEEFRQRQSRCADLLKHQLLLGAAGQSAKLADELPDGARLAAAILIARDVGTHQSPQPGFVVPMRRGRMLRTPFHPVRIGGLEIDAALAVPRHGQAEVWIQPAVVFGHL